MVHDCSSRTALISFRNFIDGIPLGFEGPRMFTLLDPPANIDAEDEVLSAETDDLSLAALPPPAAAAMVS